MPIDITFDPIIGQLGALQLGWHGVFTAIAVAVAIWLGQRRLQEAGLAAESFSSIIIWGLIGGVIGARLFHVMDHLGYYINNPLAALAIYEGGLAAYGAFMGGILGASLAARKAGFPIRRLLDGGAAAMLVGQAIGRLGCLSNGDAWGAPTGGAWGIVYRHPNDLLPPELLSVPTHPYPLYEIGAELLLVAGLWVMRRRLTVSGSMFLVTALAYSIVRFSLGFFRQETALLLGLQEAQLGAAATSLAAFGVLLVRQHIGRTSGVPRPLPTGDAV